MQQLRLFFAMALLNKKLDTLQAQQHHQDNKPRTNQGRQFYTRTYNMTNIRFTAEEMSILDMGLQYSIEKLLNEFWNDMICRVKPLRRTNAIVASCWIYFTIKHDARNHKY